MIDTQILIERMLETENLTDDLHDDDAEWLLSWGAERMREFGAAESMEAAEERAGALMKFMRGLNRLVGGLPGVDPADLARLPDHYAAAFGASRSAGELEIQDTAEALSWLGHREALEHIIQWARPLDPSPEE